MPSIVKSGIVASELSGAHKTSKTTPGANSFRVVYGGVSLQASGIVSADPVAVALGEPKRAIGAGDDAVRNTVVSRQWDLDADPLKGDPPKGIIIG
jgi:hypothetical protein